MKPNPLRADTIFDKASGLADAAERRAYLRAACAGNESLRHEVESLVAAYERCGSFLKAPVEVALPPPLLSGAGQHRFGDY